MLQRPRQGFFSRVFFILLASLLLILVLAGCDDSSPATTTTGPSTNSAPTSSSTTGDSSTATSVPATQAPALTPTPTPAHFQVTGASVSVDHQTFTGVCGNTISRIFTAVIHVPANTPGGKVTYHWIANGGGIFQTHTVSFASGQTSRTVTETAITGAQWGNGSQLWLALDVTAPNTYTSVHDTFSFVCQRNITSITASVTPTSGCNLATKTFMFSATINVTPGPGSVSVTYRWKRSDLGTGAVTIVTIPAGQTSAIVTNSWELFTPIPTNAYWEEVVASTPNGVTSNQATFDVITC